MKLATYPSSSVGRDWVKTVPSQLPGSSTPFPPDVVCSPPDPVGAAWAEVTRPVPARAPPVRARDERRNALRLMVRVLRAEDMTVPSVVRGSAVGRIAGAKPCR
ncbi:hypothetical protein DEO23_02775 [Brachybacterium endophyticum]|uniref:Uncharacterized protein n=1 Tax=Brachybacterium endophyticum TaxID=2182385 RepID=A0A2U2RNX5_9MICO|nr:hypothetical protein DEO23_02775 [Brachybacterium endophyticum]